MMKFAPRQLAVTFLLAASAAMTIGVAAESDSGVPPKSYTIPSKGVAKHIKEAVESPNRNPNLLELDGWNRPAEILALSGLRKGARVVELGPYDLYYSEMIAEAIGPKGELHMYEVPDIHEQTAQRNEAFVAKYPQAKYQGLDFNTIEFPRQVDLVFSNLYFHEMLLRGTELEPFHTKLFKAMKPGAIFLVIDHSAVLGTNTDHTGSLHRVDPTVIRQYVGAAGFELIEDSRLLENPQDDKSWPAFERGKRVQTDRIVYKFRKPVVY